MRRAVLFMAAATLLCVPPASPAAALEQKLTASDAEAYRPFR